MGPRILVVEDNAKNMKLVRDVLEYAGYEVIEATTGEEGVARAADSAPDLVLMDLQLPGIDGAEALRRHSDEITAASTAVVPSRASTVAARASLSSRAARADHTSGGGSQSAAWTRVGSAPNRRRSRRRISSCSNRSARARRSW